LKDLKLALEYAKVELSMVFSKYEEALRKVINRGRAQNIENIMESVNNLDSQQKLELTKAAMSLLLGARVH
jgi:formate dehydrogenase maturation protein FdhE